MKKIAFVFVLMLAAVAVGQNSELELAEAGGADIMAAALTAIGLAFNAGGVWFLVFLVNRYRPMLRKKAPHWIPLLSILSAPILNGLAALILQYAGIEVDFSLVIGALAGTGAVAFDQIYRQKRKAPAASRFPA